MKRITVLLLSLVATAAAAQGAYDEAALKAFRAEREKVLLADNGWFTVAGLHFLNPGENKFGSDPLNDIVLEFADVPKYAGVITMDGRNVTIKAADGQTLTYNERAGERSAAAPLPRTSGPPIRSPTSRRRSSCTSAVRASRSACAIRTRRCARISRA